MQRFWSALAVQLGKRVGLVSVVGLIVTLALGAGIGRLEFKTGQDSYLNKSDQVYKDNVAYQKLFGGEAVLTVITMDKGHTIDEAFTPAVRAEIDAIHDQLTATRRYAGVITPFTVLRFSEQLVTSANGDPTASIAAKAQLRAFQAEPAGSAAQRARYADMNTTLARLEAIPASRRTLDDPAWVKFLLYDNQGKVREALRGFITDDRHAQIIVRLRGNLSIADEGADSVAARRAVAPLSVPHGRVVTTGASFLLKDINDYLRGGMLTLGAIAVAIMVLILLLLFDVRWRLLPLLVILVGVTWAFGIAGYLGIPLTIVTIAGLPVMLGVGIDYAIQMHARVEEEARIGETGHPIQATARGLSPALLVVTFDAIFAFLALHWAKVPMLRDFGVLLAVGIAVICFNSIVLPLAILGIREYRAPSRHREWREGVLGRLVARLAKVPPAAAVPLAVASVVILAAGVAVEGKLTLQTDPIQWVNQSSRNISDIHTIEREVHSSSEMGVFVRVAKGDVFTDSTMRFIHQFTRTTRTRFGTERAYGQTLGRIATGSSLETAIGDLLDVAGASDIAPTGAEVRAAYRAADADLRSSSVSGGGTAFNIVFRTGPGSLDERAPLVRTTRSDPQPAPPAGVTATPSGLAVVGVGLLDNLEANRVVLTYLAIAFVFGFLSVRLRSVIRALLSLVPVLIAVGVASIVAYALNLKLSPMTAAGGPLVVAACTEFTSLILLRFVEERRRGHDPDAAMHIASTRTGRAFIVSALTAIAGVAVLSFSSLPLLRDFGRIVAMNVAVALLSALVVLPPMLVWAERRNWVSRGLVKPDEPMIPTSRPDVDAHLVDLTAVPRPAAVPEPVLNE